MPASSLAVDPTPSHAMRRAFAIGGAATLAGLIVHDTWRVLPAERFALSLVLALLALVWTIALCVYARPLPVAAAAMLGLGGLAVGLRLTPSALPARAAVATVVGLLLIAGLAGWTLAWPLHRAWVWWPLLLGVVAWRRTDVQAALREARDGWRHAVAASPRAAAATVVLFGLASTACWLPSLQMDDLTYHLGLPAQLRRHGLYTPDARVQMWAFAPWAGDVLHGLVGVMTGREAHGATNALWLLLLAGAAASLLTSLHAAPRERWAVLALIASLPPLVWMAAGQQTELAATTATLALVAVVVCEAPGRLWAGTVLLAALFALKLAHGLAALPLVLWAAWRHRDAVPWSRLPAAFLLFALKLAHGLAALPLVLWAAWRHRDAVPWSRLPAAVALFALVALSSEVMAWRATGNPLLPLFNDVFRSPVMPPVQLDDARWHAGFAPDLPWRMTFDTDRYLEGWDGALGFALIALGGLWLLALLRRERRGLVLAASLAMLLPLLPMQYARYAWPGLFLLLALLTVGAEARLGKRTFAWGLIALCTLDLAYQANASWLHHASVMKRTLRSPFDDTALLRDWLPERLLLRRLPEDDGTVLATDPARGFVAELGGRGRTVSALAPWLQREAQRADADGSGAGWATLLAAHDIRWALTNEASASPALRAGLHRAGAEAYACEGTTTLWRLPHTTPQGAP